MQAQPQFDIDFQMIQKELIENSSFLMSSSCIQFLNDKFSIDGTGIKNLQRSQSISKCDSSWIKVTDKVIGRGTAGQVRLGCSLVGETHIQVAVKLYHAGDKNSRFQLLNDLKTFLIGGMTCEYLVCFYGCYFEQGVVKQVIQLMDMGSLKGLLEEHKANRIEINEQILANITYSILKGLQYLHTTKRQIHRDIKPQNILINSQGKVKITDFGVSAYLQKTRTSSNAILQGSPIYMFNFIYFRSPQRIQNSHYCFNSDIWSLGIILYEFVTKSYPYQAKSIFQLTQQITNKKKCLKLTPNICSLQLCDFVSKCLQRDRTLRANAKQLLEHPWIVNNRNENCLSKFMKTIYHIVAKELDCGHH